MASGTNSSIYSLYLPVMTYSSCFSVIKSIKARTSLLSRFIPLYLSLNIVFRNGRNDSPSEGIPHITIII